MIIVEGDYSIKKNRYESAYHWDGRLADQGFISVPEYVEKNDYRLREKYLSFVNQIDEKFNDLDNGINIYKYKEYSLWWMSTIIEKNMIKSPNISDSIKMLAVEEIIQNSMPATIKLFTSDKKICNSFKDLASKLNIKLVIKMYNSDFSFYQNFKNNIPFFLRGLFCYFKNLKSYLLQTKGNIVWHKTKHQIFIASHFINFDLPNDSSNSIISNYWGGLPQLLNSNKIKMNFLNHFHIGKKVRSIKQGSKLVNQINVNSSKHGEIHHLIPFFINSKALLRVIKYYFEIYFRKKKYNPETSLFIPKNSNVNLWYFLKNDWDNSFSGSVLIENLLFIESIELYFKNLPQQKLGLFLNENNGWERAILYAWKKYQKAPIIGVAHTLIRFWDLRYFDNLSDLSNLPKSDFIAVNGPFSKKTLTDVGYNPKKILDVEALRFVTSSNNEFKSVKKDRKIKKIIFFGDIDVNSTKSMLYSLKFLTEYLSKKKSELKFEIAFKPHPINQINLDNFNIRNITIVNQKISEVIKNFDIAVSADTTTAGLEAYLAGLNVIVFRYAKRPNFSPLRKINNVHFVSNGEQLLRSIKNLSIRNSNNNNEIFFWNDKLLPRWKKIFLNHLNQI